jgi:squalene synthase HpnC
VIVPRNTLPSAAAEEAYRYCEKLAKNHYENFPVGSSITPKAIRPLIHSIYAFARIADDYADEGDLRPSERLSLLEDWQRQLDACFTGKASHPIFTALSETIRTRNIPKKPFDHLLIAFRMDVTRTRYGSFEELLGYCRHSANPVGRLVLYAYDLFSEERAAFSDHLCTALQLANFWQDVTLDLEKGRIYLPLEDLGRFGYTEHDLTQQRADDRFFRLVQYQVQRTRALFIEARPLLAMLPPRLCMELSLTWHGGMTILRKIEEGGFDVFSNRPRIGPVDKVALLIRSMRELL